MKEKTVLLVEGDEQLAKSRRDFLFAHGFIVLECNRLEQAKAIFLYHQKIIDCVVCDDGAWEEKSSQALQAICDASNVPCIKVREVSASWSDILEKISTALLGCPVSSS